ncbi:MAG TPA: DUF1499 domain-containing protein [Burkholderiaceae bacterium]|jgi:uncharacterized protein (DUF1499 family)|nr:DUF1499 domain-containing protein [Burkholderiaceae bacterium]
MTLLIVVLALPLLLLAAGQVGLLRGQPAAAPGVRDGRLAPVREQHWNAVSSQAPSDYHRIEPLRLRGEPKAAFARLRELVGRQPGVRIIEFTDTYLRAECETRALRFVDDLELLLDAPAGLVHVRSASRLGRKDFGVNRARIEALRTAYDQLPGVS